MNQPTPAFVISNQESPAFWLINNLWMPLASSHSTDGNLCFIEQICGTGLGGPCTHSHPTDEGLYVIEGHCTFQAGGSIVKAGPGTLVCLPRNVEHSFTVDEPHSRLLNFYTPGGFEMLIMSLATPAAERKVPVPDSQPMPPDWMVMECSSLFGQIAGPLGQMPFATAPTKENSITHPSDMNPKKPYALSAKDAPSYWSHGMIWTILATAEQTGGSFSLMEEIGSQGNGPPPHIHEQDEVVYLLEGELTMIAGDISTSVKAGSLTYIPKHTVHSFRIDSDQARLLNLYMPGGFEEVITTTGTKATSHTVPPTELKEREMPKVAQEALMKRVGMTVVAIPDFLRSEAE